MAEACSREEENSLNLILNRDCASPSPTETVCSGLTSIVNVPGTSQNYLLHDKDSSFLYNSEENHNHKHLFLEQLQLEENKTLNETSSENCWENYQLTESPDNLISSENENSSNSSSSGSDNNISDESIIEEHPITPKSSLKRQNTEFTDRHWRKRKSIVQNGLPCKKLLPEIDKLPDTLSNDDALVGKMGEVSPNHSNSSSCSSVATTPNGSTPKLRPVIPTKDNLPPEMSEWVIQFRRWSNAERILALNEIIDNCEPTQVRHMMQVIEPQFQRDFISLLPRELALNVLTYLEPKDLLRAAQTCKSWRFLAEDNLLWKEKCKSAGIDELPKQNQLQLRNSNCNKLSDSPKSPGGGVVGMSPWKAAYMRQHMIETNWRSRPIKPPKMLKGHDDHVITCLQFSGNRIVSGSDDNTLKVWNVTTGKCLRTLVGHTGGVWSSQMSGNIIISGSTDRTLKVWDIETGVCKHTLSGHTSTVRCMHLHGNKVVSGSRDATLRVWNIETGACLQVLVGHMAAVRCVQYDGRLVVSGAYDYTVKVWNVERAECLHTLQGHTNRVYSLQFDGVHVVSGSLDTSIRVWEVETGACKHTLMGHQSLTSGMELRNNILVSGNADSTVKVWDTITGQCLQTLSGPYKHQSAVTCLQFNNRFVITSSDDGTVKLWDVKTGEFIRNLVALESGGSGGVVWRIRASDTKLVCAVGSRNGTEETKLLVLDFDVESMSTNNNNSLNNGKDLVNSNTEAATITR